MTHSSHSILDGRPAAFSFAPFTRVKGAAFSGELVFRWWRPPAVTTASSLAAIHFYINVPSHDFIAASASRREEARASQSQSTEARAVVATLLGVSGIETRVGIDTLTLMVTDPRSRDALTNLGKADYECLQRKLRGCSVRVCRFACPHPLPGVGGVRWNVIFRLSVAASANLLRQGRAPLRRVHNSYVASREEVQYIASLIGRECAAAGVKLDLLWLQIVRLDAFVDAVLSASARAYFDLLQLMARSARLGGGLRYANGICGFGNRYAWCFYGKGHLLLQRAQKRGALEALLEERSREEWEQLFRLEMRWKGAEVVRQVFPEKAGEERAAAPLPRMCLGELLERWDDLPSRYRETVLKRCLVSSCAALTAGAKAAQQRLHKKPARSQRDACGVEWFWESLRRTDRKKGLGLDWRLLENLPVFNPEARTNHAVIDFYQASPLVLLREHLKGTKLSSGTVSAICARYRRALFEREVCRGSDILERYEEMEHAFFTNVRGARARRLTRVRKAEPTRQAKTLQAKKYHLPLRARVVRHAFHPHPSTHILPPCCVHHCGGREIRTAGPVTRTYPMHGPICQISSSPGNDSFLCLICLMICPVCASMERISIRLRPARRAQRRR